MARKIDPARRENILLAARAVFRENGYARSRMSAIARRAGVADGTVYLYFKSKLDLVNALCEDYLKRKVMTLSPILNNNHGNATAIAACIHTALVLAEEDRDILRLLDLRTSLGKRGQRLQWDREFSRMLARKFEEGRKQGEMWPYDSEVAAELVVGLLEWIAKFCLVWTNHKMARYEGTVIAMLQHALLRNGPDEGVNAA